MAEEAQIKDEMPKAYDPKAVEQKWYKFWLEKGYFTPKIDPKKKPFVIIMPPPNVTGELHVGHALTATIEDILTRWHRMKGDPALWLPGVDHASIATQYIVQRNLAKEGLDRQSMGRGLCILGNYVSGAGAADEAQRNRARESLNSGRAQHG